MKTYGLPLESVENVARTLDLRLDNVRTHKTYVEFKLNPPSSKHAYARTSHSGRALKACSYEAFRDFILACFDNGATKVATAFGTWHTRRAFIDDLPRLGRINIGSQALPCSMRSVSNRETPDPTVY